MNNKSEREKELISEYRELLRKSREAATEEEKNFFSDL